MDKVNDRIRLLLDDMLDTLHATENRAAIAANQVGILKRLVVIDYLDYQLKLANPQMLPVKMRWHWQCYKKCRLEAVIIKHHLK